MTRGSPWNGSLSSCSRLERSVCSSEVLMYSKVGPSEKVQKQPVAGEDTIRLDFDPTNQESQSQRRYATFGRGANCSIALDSDAKEPTQSMAGRPALFVSAPLLHMYMFSLTVWQKVLCPECILRQRHVAADRPVVEREYLALVLELIIHAQPLKNAGKLFMVVIILRVDCVRTHPNGIGKHCGELFASEHD